MNAFGPPASGLRVIRIVLICVALGTLVNTGGGVLLFTLNAKRVDQINSERARNTVSSCVRTSGQNAAIVAFLVERGASRETVSDGRKFFPVLTRAQCEAQARRTVDTD